MQTEFKTSNRVAAPVSGLAGSFKPLFALALMVAVAAPLTAHAADDELLPERGISVVPIETPDAGAAADIAALANAGEEAETPAAPAAEAPVADLADANASLFAGAENPADVYEQLLETGFEVSVVRRDHNGSYVFLVDTDHADRSVLVLVDAAGTIVDHRRIDPVAHAAPAYVAPAHVAPAYVAPAYVAPAHVAPAYVATPYGHNRRPSAYQGCQQPSAGYHSGYANASRWARY